MINTLYDKLIYYLAMIGSELSKEERTSLHRSVRLTFPHLKTEAICKEQEVKGFNDGYMLMLR